MILRNIMVKKKRATKKMKAVGFFSKSEIQLPLTRPDGDFQKYISELFAEYLVLLRNINGSDDISKIVIAKINDAVALCDSIKKAVGEYLDGHPYNAHKTIKNELDGLKRLLRKLWVQKVADIRTNRIYRMRLGCNVDISIEGIFHVPYEQRHKVATQRYSIPGLPCLYLGGSLYTCWCEMGSPSFEDIHVSAFLVDRYPELKFLDFAKTPKWIANWLSKHQGPFRDHEEMFLSTQIILWPLIASCSIKTLHSSASFNTEYIIPQILLQWITKNIADFDGIRYFSTHIEDTSVDNPHWICNYVLPVRQISSKGYCTELKQKFRLTKPHLWRILRAVNLSGRDSSMRDNFEIELIPGIKEPYGDTEFGKVQWSLNCIMQDQSERLK
jgi:hypothetical protein